MRAFGSTGMNVSVLGFGGSEIGAAEVDFATVDQILGAALDVGVNVIDTAECYGNSEEKIGKALVGKRDSVYLFTKCGHQSGFGGEDWEPDMLRRTIDRSLQRLNTDYVDLVQLHTCTQEHLEQGDVVRVLLEAKQAGKTRFIGYSGDSFTARYALEMNVFDCLQTSVNVMDQEAIDLTLPLAAEKGIGVIAKRPIANAVMLRTTVAPGSYESEYWDRWQVLDYPELKGEDPVSIALQFTLAQPAVATAIVGTRRPENFVRNVESLRRTVSSPEIFAALRARWREVAGADWHGRQ